MNKLLVLHSKRAFFDILEGVTSSNIFALSSRLLDAPFLLCLKLLSYSLQNCACSFNKISI